MNGEKVKITTLIENHGNCARGILGEHGLSMFVETEGKRILFDTGQTGEFMANAKTMKVNLNNIDLIVLSHGHYDHTGGIIKMLKETECNADILVGHGFFSKKYKRLPDGNYHYNGNPFEKSDLQCNKNRIMQVEENIYSVTENILLFRGFEEKNNFEKFNPNFFLEKDGSYQIDKFADEVVLGIKTDKGLIIIVGCSHVGVINIIHTIKEQLNMPIRGLIGGTHLIDADEGRLDKTIQELQGLNLEFLAVSHCTGDMNIDRMKQAFKEKFIYNTSGNIIEI